MGMRQTIELLRKQTIEAGLTSAHIQSMGKDQSVIHSIDSTPSSHYGTSTMSSVSIDAVGTAMNAPINRHHSSDSMCSLNSLSSKCSMQDKKKKSGWLRTSFRKAFTRHPKTGNKLTMDSTLEEGSSMQSLNLLTATNGQLPVAASPTVSPTKTRPPHRMMPFIENAEPIDAIDGEKNQIVEDLKKQLREKDLVLTDIRLEALSSASQLESLKDTVSKMRQEMMNLKHNNERLQKMVTSKSLAGSEVSLGNAPVSPNGSESRRYSLADGSLRAVSVGQIQKSAPTSINH